MKTVMPTRRAFFISLAVVFFATRSTSAQELRVAAAADLQFAMVELVSEFQKTNSAKVEISYGSSGNFFSQLQNGAPFDLFFSADVQYPQKLEAASLAEPGTLYEYAQGRIVLWTPADSRFDVLKVGWKALLDPRVQKIAIANPEHAPYGRAAVEALHKAGIYDEVKRKLVHGENISQAAQFVQSGNAEVGIIALSLAVSPAMRDGKSWEIPGQQHEPIRQAAIVLKRSKNKDAARALLDFVKSEPGQKILERFGFIVPAADAAEKKS
jgi:molybdate transport system substrate-binding protein